VPRAIERLVLVDHRGVMRSEDEEHDDQEHGPEQVARSAGEDQQAQGGHRGEQRDAARTPAKDGIADVAAVELTDWREVEGGGQQAEPGGPAQRVQVHGLPGRQRAEEQPLGQLEDQRLAELDALEILRQRDGLGQAHAENQHGHQHDEPGEGAGNADVEDLAFRRDALPDPDDGAEGPRRGHQRQPERNEVGKRGVDSIVSAREVVAELVCAENRQDADAVPEAAEQDRWH
jgi:hypothetical protein